MVIFISCNGKENLTGNKMTCLILFIVRVFICDRINLKELPPNCGNPGLPVKKTVNGKCKYCTYEYRN